MTQPFLEVRALSAGYGDILAVRDIDLDVSVGEVVAILGTNGAGKTTLLHSVVGLVPMAMGEVFLERASIAHLRPHARVRRGLALVQENKRIFRGLSVQDNLVVATPRIGRSEFNDRMAWLHELFPVLAEKHREPAGSLSGGQQQMLAIGQSLMTRPKVLMLDEPSAGLAPKLVAEVMDRVAEIARQGIAVLLVEQAVHQALRIASRVYVLRLGCCEEHADFRATEQQRLLEHIYLGRKPQGTAGNSGLSLRKPRQEDEN